MGNVEEILNKIIEDFVKKSWFYLNDERKVRVVNATQLIEYIEFLKGE